MELAAPRNPLSEMVRFLDDWLELLGLYRPDPELPPAGGKPQIPPFRPPVGGKPETPPFRPPAGGKPEAPPFRPPAGGKPASKHRWFPEVSLQREPDAIIVRVALPGFGREDIDLQVSSTKLYLGAHGRGQALLPRAIPLPCEIDVDRVEAEYREGVLRVVCPRLVPGRRIDIE